MGSKAVVKGAWSSEEDQKLAKFIENNGLQLELTSKNKSGKITWEIISNKAGLNRCPKSCRLRWKNYLNPHIKRGDFSEEEILTIIELHSSLGNRWAQIAAKLPGRTDNQIKNFCNTKFKKKLNPQTPKINYQNFQGDYLMIVQAQQEYIRRQEEIVKMALNLYINDHIQFNGFGNELNAAGNNIDPTNVASDACFEVGGHHKFQESGNMVESCNNDLTQYCMQKDEVQQINLLIDDQLMIYADPNSFTSNFDYVTGDDHGVMHGMEILASFAGFSPPSFEDIYTMQEPSTGHDFGS